MSVAQVNSAMFKFQRVRNRKFKPPMEPLPQRVLATQPMNAQIECAFYTRLPPEIRNDIYKLVFSTNAGIVTDTAKSKEQDQSRRSPSLDIIPRSSTPIAEDSTTLWKKMIWTTAPPLEPQAHPLSILLTCRRINQEATVLAFNTYAFIFSTVTTFHRLRTSTSHLSRLQFDAISRLAYDFDVSFTYNHRQAADFAANAILLFPNISRVELCCRRFSVLPNQMHVPFAYREETDFEEATRKYVPHWYSDALKDVVENRSFSWQKGSRWKVEWPQIDADPPEFEMEYTYGSYDRPVRLRWVGGVPESEEDAPRGTAMCCCGCGDLVWTKGLLVQETGRRVEIETVFYGCKNEYESERERRGLLVRLREGAERLSLVERSGGMGWEVDRKYWERLRKRNRRWLKG
ncbi:hypothetical protein EJ04DRAFT_571586 [Polyplosphaeria fusca]|uniref:DUF7730 domain-containing protein n=1 Tax=Polyplosphaeria fusca TaxID=682080 RepID=A0A9P4RD63_9PLEO|nr:hypothetical protein EJ04DRAFT_571586 [Polyplosphaeria fusca]